MMINQPAVVRDTRMGSILEKYLSSGELDSVGALQLWLLAHRELGSESEYAPYFASLSKPDVPTAYPDSTLRELAGTELHAAVQELREKLGRTWGNAQPILREVALACTMDLERLTLEDWMWAFSILTSRSFNIPADSKSPGSTVMSLVPGLPQCYQPRGWHDNLSCDDLTGSTESLLCHQQDLNASALLHVPGSCRSRLCQSQSRLSNKMGH